MIDQKQLAEDITEAESFFEFEQMTRGSPPNCWVRIIANAHKLHHLLSDIEAGKVKIVPCEPTEDMIEEMRTIHDAGVDHRFPVGPEQYRAMLSAAPQYFTPEEDK